MSKKRILVVDDEPDAVELLEHNLRSQGYAVSTAADGFEALQKAATTIPDLIILDLMMPELDGLEVCKRLRGDPNTARVNILMLTARTTEIDRVLGFELGADDYVVKPFSLRELMLRVKSLLGRERHTDHEAKQIQIGELLIDIEGHTAVVDGSPINLTVKEFALVSILARRRGRVQTRETLLRDVWHYDQVIDTRTVDTHIRRLREKLGSAARHIDTVRGVGYRFRGD